MHIFSEFKFSALLAGILLVVAFVSCEEEEFTTIGEGLVGKDFFATGKTDVYNVTVVNKKLDAVQTNQLSVYQLGEFNDPVYGKTEAQITSQLQLATYNPTFGAFSQQAEDSGSGTAIQENETITKVLLYIPYFNSGALDANTNEVENDTVPKAFKLDSIYGNSDKEFNLVVKESTYFLRDLDPNTGFQEPQEYFSTQEFSSFTGETLFDGNIMIDDEEILTIIREDDPNTEVDETNTVSRRREPGIEVSLNAAFFQQHIIDKEGESELLSATNFKEFIRGINISIIPTEELMLLLDITNANIEITYEHDTSGGEKEEKTFTINLITGGGTNPIIGNAVNTFINDEYPTDILDRFDAAIKNTPRIHLKGGAGAYAEIKLFAEGDLAEIKANNWIINEANLVFYVDREGVTGSVEPPRLYLFNTETNEPLYAIRTETSSSNTPLGIFLNYDGLLDDSDPDNLKYTVRITEHINAIIAEGESANVKLGLAVSPDIRITAVNNAILSDDSEEDIPVASTLTPLGTVLHGSSSEKEGKKLKLELFYTQIN